MQPAPLHLRLPATSANLGPGFDALGLAMALFLDVRAEAAEAFSIDATGRNPELVGALRGNLLLSTYRALAPNSPPLHLRLRNEIPLGMGCGSSAAALLAGVQLANHFGRLGWTAQQVLEEACRLEGHPDNVASCFHGGLTVSGMDTAGRVTTASFPGDPAWKLFLALPQSSLATTQARALLPDHYTRADAVANVQATALLVAAFAQNRPELLRASTRDRMHQPFRAEACPLLPRLLPLGEREDVYSVTLSGAGPSVLLIASAAADPSAVRSAIRHAAQDETVEVLETQIPATV